MANPKKWTVTIEINELDRRTHAQATLDRASMVTSIAGEGVARRNPDDSEVPQIGDELAAARALSDLAHRLIMATVEDIEASTHVPAHLEV
ncbi:DUF1876 domain-containing protein [Rhodococcus sp. D2-41]|uniref:DUF1876 domain-containing protein n=1 Tax=Speluncibacter jeojiensis TaxID=2710754 RepID=A0A9X4RF58_9ACTN|nr:DUF1876 domain-containing protein [Rhodococcus sp. D2-41]MDG3011363.1 DUF1876 domain-containing protein [Rhodococcus sp. D2-41]MDG3016625.1 DUF1876 domain-containing protein [Corynebacteriales bacterium D3-21]